MINKAFELEALFSGDEGGREGGREEMLVCQAFCLELSHILSL